MNRYRAAKISEICVINFDNSFTLFRSFLLAQPRDVIVEVGAGAVVAGELLIEAATQVADVALGADEEDGHLEGTATDGEEADDVALLFGHGFPGIARRPVAFLVGLVLGILLLEGVEELGMLTVDLVEEGLPFLGCRVGVLR